MSNAIRMVTEDAPHALRELWDELGKHKTPAVMRAHASLGRPGAIYHFCIGPQIRVLMRMAWDLAEQEFREPELPPVTREEFEALDARVDELEAKRG